MPEFDVFLSFSGNESDRVDDLRKAMEARDLAVFMDRTQVRPGEPLSTTIEQGLRNSKLFVVYYSHRYARRHACQFELVHAYIADDREGRRSRLMVINPEEGRSHIAPVKLQDALYVKDCAGTDLGSLVNWINERAESLDGTFSDIDFGARPRSHGDSPSVAARVFRYGDMWRLLTALTREDYRMTQHPGNRTALLTGLPGAGKTTLVDDFVQYFGYSYEAIYRLDLRGRLDNYDGEIAKHLEVDRKDAEAELDRRAKRGPQLWIVDNVPSDLTTEEIKDLPMSVPGVGTILVTRGGPTPECGEEVRLEGLTEDEAADLVAHLYPLSADEEDGLSAALATGVSRHPMALARLARDARALHTARTFAEHVGRVLDGSDSGMAAIVRPFTEHLRGESDPVALTLLRLAGECAPDPLPVRFTCLLLRRFDIDERTVLAAVARLCDTHLAARDDASWSVHPVVRLAARDLSEAWPTAADLAAAAAAQLTQSVLEPTLLSQARHLCERRDLAPHVRQVLLARIATTLSEQRRPAVAGRYFDRLFEEFPTMAQDRSVLVEAARNHADAGELERAADYAQAAGDRADALVLLAGVLDAQGRFDEAEPAWRRAIEHPDLAAASSAERVAVDLEWIRSRRVRGEPAAQRPRLRAILDRADELPVELANLARLELAEIDMVTDQQENARHLTRVVVEFYEAHSTPHDPVAVRARYALANADLTLGLLEFNPDRELWKNAEVSLRAQYTEQEKELGVRNIVTLTTRTAIGLALIFQGRAREARDHAKTARSVLERRVGLDHPLYFRCLYVLGMAYLQLGKFPQAVENLNDAHHGQVLSLGKAHPETLRTQFELAMALKLRGKEGKSWANVLLTEVRKLSPKATGRVNDLYWQGVAATILARHAPVRVLRWAHRSNHASKWTEE